MYLNKFARKPGPRRHLAVVHVSLGKSWNKIGDQVTKIYALKNARSCDRLRQIMTTDVWSRE